MRAGLRGVQHLAVIFGLVGILSGSAGAAALYSVTNLGPANSSGSYLGALSASDQSAFQSGSFDVYAHPATVSGLGEFHQGDIVRTDLMDGDIILSSPSLVTSNNLGVNAGTSFETLPNLGSSSTQQLVIFLSDPHTVTNPSNGQTLQSPGYLSQYFTKFQFQFWINSKERSRASMTIASSRPPR